MITTGRGQVSGFRFAVASPHNLTSAVAAGVLEGGGNAVDAAIAANAVQGTVAPETCGIGGDLFALVWAPGATEPAALNASGWAGSGVSASDLRDAGLDSIPNDHPASVSIPGAVAGWFALADAFGSSEVADLLAPAIAYADEGFPASSEFARATAARFDRLSHQPSAQSFYPDGAPARLGARIRRPLLRETLHKIASEGRDGFYRGSVAADISSATAGSITDDDLAGFEPEWVEPARAETLGRTGWTIGPNSQGYLILASLRVFELAGGRWDPSDPYSHHLLIESYRAMAAERDDVVSDPMTAPLSWRELLDDERLAPVADSIEAQAGRFAPPSRRPGGTAYLSVVDGSGLAVALIQSNFHGIGSNIGAGSSGFILHNRGAGATLEPGHPNELMAGRRPLHTLAPTIWSKGGTVTTTIGTRGGHQQPQLVAQVAAHLFGGGDQPWSALARPRWTMTDFSPSSSSHIGMEAAFDDDIVEGLRSRGHGIEVVEGPTGGSGPVSVITVDGDGLLTAAADPRVDTAQAIAR